MKDAAHTVTVTSAFRRLVVVTGIVGFLLVALPGLVSTATATADVPNATQPDNGSVVLTFDGDGFVHQDEFVYVWRREPLAVQVGLGDDVDGNRVCLSRSSIVETRRGLGCKMRDGSGDTLVFEDVNYAAGGPVSYRFEVRVLGPSDQVLSTKRSRRIVQITNWSDLDEDEFDDYVEHQGFVNVTGDDGRDATAKPAGRDGNGSAVRTNASRGANASGHQPEPEQQISEPKDIGERVTVPTLGDTADTLSSSLVLVVGGSGLLALLGLIAVQRRRETEEPGYATGSAPVLQPTDEDRALTDAEIVVQLLAENGGRLKQSAIVEATDWSKAKVSRLLSRMDDHGHIHKQKDGRQNIIILRRGN